MDELYQKQILNYAQKSRAIQALEKPTHAASLDNPTCGDRVDISLIVIKHHVKKMGVKVRGCALCEAGAGLAIDCFTDQSDEKIQILTENFARWIGGDDDWPPLPNMQIFRPVRNIHNRHKCVLLPFNATLKALSRR